MKNLNNMTTEEIQDTIWEVLESKSGEEVLRAFTNWHGTQLLTGEFLEALSDDGMTDEEYGYFDDEEDEEIEEEDDDDSDEDTKEFLDTLTDDELEEVHSKVVKLYETLAKVALDSSAKETQHGQVDHVRCAFKALVSLYHGEYTDMLSENHYMDIRLNIAPIHDVLITLTALPNKRPYINVNQWVDYKDGTAIYLGEVERQCKLRLGKEFPDKIGYWGVGQN